MGYVRNTYKVLVCKLGGRRSLRMLRCGWKEILKEGLKKEMF
jgi:hypothetical protein